MIGLALGTLGQFGERSNFAQEGSCSSRRKGQKEDAG